MAVPKVFVSAKRYTDEFRTEAARRVSALRSAGILNWIEGPRYIQWVA
jgi:hypothetical protein